MRRNAWTLQNDYNAPIAFKASENYNRSANTNAH